MDCSRIYGRLWVGAEPRDDADVRYLQALQITAILSLQDAEDRGDDGIAGERNAALQAGFQFENVPVKDFSPADLQLRLRDCVAALSRLVDEGHSVYVHCTAGVSRSPTVVAAYLHWRRGWELQEAVTHLRACRRCSPDEQIIRQAASIDTLAQPDSG